MKTKNDSLRFAVGLFSLGWLAGCESPSNTNYLDDRGTPYGVDGYVSVGVGVGYYDPWYYGGPGYYPPVAVVPPPIGGVGGGMGPRPTPMPAGRMR